MVGKLSNILTGIKTQGTNLRSSSLSHAWFKQQQCLMRKWWCLVPNGWKVRKKRYWTSYWMSPMWELTNSLQMLIKTPKALISGEKKFSNCHDCKPFNTHRPMTSWKAHCLQLCLKPTFTHFPVKGANCHHNQETDLHTIKEGILKTFFTFISTKASSRTENQCSSRRRMQVSRFCNRIFCLENIALGNIKEKKKKQWKPFITDTVSLPFFSNKTMLNINGHCFLCQCSYLYLLRRKEKN